MELGAIWVNINLLRQVRLAFERQHPDLHGYWSSRHKPVQKPNLVPLLQQTSRKNFKVSR